MGKLEVLRWSGEAASLLEEEPPRELEEALVFMEPKDSAVVVGSSCPAPEKVLGYQVLRRKGGGGAVLVDGGLLWFSVFFKVDSPFSDPTPEAAFLRVGRYVREKLEPAGLSLSLYEGPPATSGLGKWLCFASRVKGELLRAGKKVLGLSQHRSSRWVRIDAGLLLTWDPIKEAVLASILSKEDVGPLTTEAVAEGVGLLKDEAISLLARD